jgi:hypothetical protein
MIIITGWERQNSMFSGYLFSMDSSMNAVIFADPNNTGSELPFLIFFHKFYGCKLPKADAKRHQTASRKGIFNRYKKSKELSYMRKKDYQTWQSEVRNFCRSVMTLVSKKGMAKRTTALMLVCAMVLTLSPVMANGSSESSKNEIKAATEETANSEAGEKSEDLQDEDVTATDNTDGVPAAVLEDDNVVAKIGSEGYQTIAAAITAAKTQDNATIKLMSNCEEAVEIPYGTTVTLDLNGYTLSNSGSLEKRATIYNLGTLTVIDSSTDKTGIVNSVANGKPALLNGDPDWHGTADQTHNIAKDAIAILKGGTFTRSNEDSKPKSNTYYTIQNLRTMEIYDGVTVNQGKN